MVVMIVLLDTKRWVGYFGYFLKLICLNNNLIQLFSTCKFYLYFFDKYYIEI